jgi:nucleotide-binding universal stress UspA family protein
MDRILVGVDGSWGSREAVRYAVDLAKTTGSRLIIATVVYFHKAFGAPELEMQVEVWEEEENLCASSRGLLRWTLWLSATAGAEACGACCRGVWRFGCCRSAPSR